MRHRDVTETSHWTGRCKKGEERTHGIVWSLYQSRKRQQRSSTRAKASHVQLCLQRVAQKCSHSYINRARSTDYCLPELD